ASLSSIKPGINLRLLGGYWEDREVAGPHDRLPSRRFLTKQDLLEWAKAALGRVEKLPAADCVTDGKWKLPPERGMPAQAGGSLLVEDNPSDLELTLHALRKHKLANRIHVVRDGAEALDFLYARGPFARRASGDRPCVVLLDLKLPKIDGLEVLRRL